MTDPHFSWLSLLSQPEPGRGHLEGLGRILERGWEGVEGRGFPGSEQIPLGRFPEESVAAGFKDPDA